MTFSLISNGDGSRSSAFASSVALGTLAVGLYGNNLTDKAYKTDGQDFSNIGSIRTVYYGAPRTFTLRLTARY